MRIAGQVNVSGMTFVMLMSGVPLSSSKRVSSLMVIGSEGAMVRVLCSK